MQRVLYFVLFWHVSSDSIGNTIYQVYHSQYLVYQFRQFLKGIFVSQAF